MWKPTVSSDEIWHHGILGQKYGKRNGPPYPLDASDHSAKEKAAGWKESLHSKDTKARHKQLAKKYKEERKKMNKQKENADNKENDIHQTKEYKEYATLRNDYEDAIKGRNGKKKSDAPKYKKRMEIAKSKLDPEKMKKKEDELISARKEWEDSLEKLRKMSR